MASLSIFFPLFNVYFKKWCSFTNKLSQKTFQVGNKLALIWKMKCYVIDTI